MDLNALGALTAYTYQSTLSQTGNADQALAQALSASQSLAADTSALLASVGPVEPMHALSGDSNSQAQTSLFLSSSSSGDSSGTAQGLLSSLLGSSSSALFSGSDSLPSSAALLSPGTTEALVRYAYDQSQNPTATAHQLASSAQQSVSTSGLNLLA